MICLDGKGTPLWTYKSGERNLTAPAIADLNGDGKNEIVIGSKKTPLLCISSKGKKLWSLKKKGATGSSPIIYDINSDGIPEILVGIGHGIAAVNHKGKILWRYAMDKELHDAISAGDVDGDGEIEIIVVDLAGKVACLSATGKEKWTADVKERVRRSPVIADVDDNGVIEILISGYSNELYVFDPYGNLKELVPLKNTMDASPTIVDFKGNGRLSVICPVAGELLALSWMNAVPASHPIVLWPEYRFNSQRTASAFQPVKKPAPRIAKIDYGGFYVGYNEYSVTVENPERKNLSLFLEMSKNGGNPITIDRSSRDSVFTVKLPYTIFGRETVNLKLSCTLKMGDDIVAHQVHSKYIEPFAKDIADLEKTLTDISSIVPKLPEPAYVTHHLRAYKQQLSEFKEKAVSAGTIPINELQRLRENIAAARTESEKLLKISEAVIKAGNVLVAYAANPWAPFGAEDEILEDRILSPNITVEAFGGETESAAINLTNYGNKTLTVRVEPTSIESKDDSVSVSFRNVFKFHEVLDVPTQDLDLSADALPLIGQARTLIIPAWSIRQLWINVDVSALSPGEWTARIKFRSLEIEPKEACADISIRVFDSHLPDKQLLRLCHWGYVHSSILKDQPLAAFDDQVAHGTNVFVATSTFAPKAEFDANGDIVGQIDFTRHDDYVRRHAPHGIILFCGYQGSLQVPAPRFSSIWAKAYKNWLRAWVKHLNELGIGYENYALYPVDEPGLRPGLVDLFISYAKLARQENPEIQIYTDPVMGATLNDIKRMTPYVDIWCPNRGCYLVNEAAERLAYIKATGKTVWTYECELNAKHQSPLGYYRAQAWFVWHHGLTGIGFWSYCTSKHDPWYAPGNGFDYLLIYQGDGVVSSKRWEAIRDGIEDFGMLNQLNDAVKRISQTDPSSKTVLQAKQILKQDAHIIAQYCGSNKLTLAGPGGFSAKRTVEDQHWEKIQTTRRKIAELLAKLSCAK